MSGALEGEPRAMILAAGLSTRLGALGAALPKPLLPVVDVPVIHYVVSLLVGEGVREICVNLHHHGALLRESLGDGSAFGARVVYSDEAEILGTGGGLVKMRDWLTRGGTTPFFVVNGKLLVDVDLGALWRRHNDTRATATLVVRATPDARRWGAIFVDDLDGQARVVGMLDRGRTDAAAYMFCGVHVVSPALLARLPAEGESDSIRQAYMPALLDGARLSALGYAGYFAEHSTPARYLEGNFAVLAGRAQLRHPPPGFRGATGAGPVHVGAGAQVAGRLGGNVVVGAGAHVGAHASLDNVVMWPRTRVDTALHDCIVTPDGVVSGAPGPRDF